MNRAGLWWAAFAALSVGLIVIAGTAWAADHPDGTSWDESGYFSQALVDLEHMSDGGPTAVARGFLKDDATRPPMYRVLALPASVVFGFSPLTLRLVSITFFVATLLIVFLTVRGIAGGVAASVSVVLLSISPVMVSSSIVFGTEYPLYFASAAMLFFLTRMWNRQQERAGLWIGLGLSLGVGALAKTTFALLAAPALAVTILLSWRGFIDGPDVKQLAKAVGIGALVALPWWAINIGPALSYARYSGNFVRHSLGSSLTDEVPRWLGQFVDSELGPASAIFVASVVLVVVVGRVINRVMLRLDHSQLTILLICFITPVPLIVSQFVGGNANTWHIAPALIFLSVGIGLLVPAARWVSVRWLPLGAALALSSQLLMLLIPSLTTVVYPTNSALFDVPPWLVMARQEQWDWGSLRDLAESRRLPHPSISFLGSARELNPPAIAFPWATHHVSVQVTWLWRYEDGPIDWTAVMKSVEASDIVLTPPSYLGDRSNKEDLDNQYNAEFVGRLLLDPRFEGPVSLVVGRYEPVKVAIFVRRSSALGLPVREAAIGQ